MKLTVKSSAGTVGTQLDLTPFIAKNGVKWQRADVESPNAGRALNGEMLRLRVATKVRLDVTCRPLTATAAATVLGAIGAEYVYVDYTDPMYGNRTNVKMYSNNHPATYCMQRDGVDYWNGITFPLVEA